MSQRMSRVGSCVVEGCDRPIDSGGLCGAHRLRVSRGSRDVLAPVRPRAPRRDPVCSVEGCAAPHVARGLCGWHYRADRDERQPECEGPGCNRRARARGLCVGHLAQERKGQSLTPLRTRGVTA